MAELIVALDFDDALEALNMATSLRGHVSWVKVGLELFITEGPRVIHSLKGVGYNVFLDLKLHDIPNTVRGAALASAMAGADIVTIHLAGGECMCKAAVEAVASHTHQPQIFGVTVLTSLADGELPGCSMPLSDLAMDMADNAADWGLQGIVCSGQEVKRIKSRNLELKCLTPGIRMNYEGMDDQRRVMTPAQAVTAGSDFLVVGRPITKAKDPAQAAAEILEDMRRATL